MNMPRICLLLWVFIAGCGPALVTSPRLSAPEPVARWTEPLPRGSAQDEAIVRDGDAAYCFGYTARTRDGSEVLLKMRTWCLETPSSCEQVRQETVERVRPLGGAILVSEDCRSPFLMSCHTSISRDFGPAQTCSLLETECAELRLRKLQSSAFRDVSPCGLVRPRPADPPHRTSARP